jgi:hypothetical protein
MSPIKANIWVREGRQSFEIQILLQSKVTFKPTKSQQRERERWRVNHKNNSRIQKF